MISIIAACSKNNVIGIGQKMPWHLPKDLSRFKKLTVNHHIIMGRKTYESIGKPLSNRTNIVISRNNIDNIKIICAKSVQEALSLAPTNQEVFIIGGGEIYKQTIGIASRIYLTKVDKIIEGDNLTYFPLFDINNYDIVESISYPLEGEFPAHDFIIYKNKLL